MNKLISAHLYIYGRVQGVFFRASTRRIALKLGLKGFVRNLPDGRVEAYFEGEEERVREAVDWCHHGPPGARVERVRVQWEEYRGDLKGFEIRY